MAGNDADSNDESFFSELLDQFSDPPAPDDDEELAAFLDGLDQQSSAHEEAEIRSLLEGMPNINPLDLPPLGPTPEPSNEELGDRLIADEVAAAEIIAAFAGGEGAPEDTTSDLDAVGASGSDESSVALEPSSEGSALTPKEDVVSKASSLSGGLGARLRPRLFSTLGPPTPVASSPATTVTGLTLKDLFGFEPGEESEAPAEPASEPLEVDSLGPRKAFAWSRLHRFFVDFIGGQVKLSVIDFLIATGIDRVSTQELVEALSVSATDLDGALGSMVKDGLLIEGRGRYSINARSRNILPMASLVAGWQDSKRRAEIEGWFAPPMD